MNSVKLLLRLLNVYSGKSIIYGLNNHNALNVIKKHDGISKPVKENIIKNYLKTVSQTFALKIRSDMIFRKQDIINENHHLDGLEIPQLNQIQNFINYYRKNNGYCNDVQSVENYIANYAKVLI
ncbi:unnamed protein product [Brachionus calyciflorus]|uniref:Uncharacterized protein n=1 Tax=Brachionus calyciflorus TaxID=104777 RepID=A0A814A1W1_9BILA|nr:unnamed protein product [Brachionus calyciflorus]